MIVWFRDKDILARRNGANNILTMKFEPKWQIKYECVRKKKSEIYLRQVVLNTFPECVNKQIAERKKKAATAKNIALFSSWLL